MTDFVSRVAARAVGQAAIAQPRLSDARVPEPFGEHEQPSIVMAVPAPQVTVGAEQEITEPTTSDSKAAFSRPRPESTAPGISPDGAVVPESTSAEAPEATPRARDHPAELVITSPRRQTAPLVAATAAKPIGRAAPAVLVPASRSAMPTADFESPGVRVHIGRLEVRANLEPEPRRAEPAPAPGEPEPSLGEYLRGGRRRP
jgi:hypothetical protein